tara:strand:- start:1712 stop:2140 length:429 start_codon:yes stop_codon:yes gene_type:complete
MQGLKRLWGAIHYFSKSKDQEKFHQDMIACCLHIIFGTGIDHYIGEIKKYCNWTDEYLGTARKFLAITTPRRWGKTYSVAMFIASVITSLSPIRVCVFSTGRRASLMLLNLVKSFCSKLMVFYLYLKLHTHFLYFFYLIILL